MKEFIVKTNFGHTYKWSAELIAQDYSATAIQWQHEEDVLEPKTREQLYQEIINDEDFIWQWFADYISHDVDYSVSEAELIQVDEKVYNDFINWAISTFGKEV